MPHYSGENREKHSEFPVAGPWSECRISGIRIQSLNTTSHCVALSGLRVNVLIHPLKLQLKVPSNFLRSAKWLE